jgi:hypothetical protein
VHALLIVARDWALGIVASTLLRRANLRDFGHRKPKGTYSKGRWEGDALVVETRGLNGKQWLDHGGLPASDKLTVTERFRRPSFGRLEIDITINDPTYYTKPWTATTNLRAMPDTELFEFICNENEKSTPHMGPHIK